MSADADPLPLPAVDVVKVAETDATVVVAVDPSGDGEELDPEAVTRFCSSLVRACCSCCCFFLTSCSALLRSSRVTPWVERRVSRTRLACALRWVSLSSSRTGGTNDLQEESQVNKRHALRYAMLLFSCRVKVFTLKPGFRHQVLI